MLYRIFYYLFKLTVKGYFRSIYIKGKENIPAEGPVIFTPNHTSAFMDSILLGTAISRSIYFLARGDVFKNKWVARLLHGIHMIPIYRKSESPDHHIKNEDTFRLCFDHLTQGGALMIFPEGVSKTERRLRPFKTGTARIALGAEQLNKFSLGVQIIPIGINYSNPHHFRSDVFVQIGKPIPVSQYRETYQKENWQTVTDLTAQIKNELEKLVIIIENERLDRLIRQIEILYRHTLRDNSKQEEKAPQDFYLSKEIVKAVEFHMKENPERVRKFEMRISAYLKDIKRLGIRDTIVRTSGIQTHLLSSLAYFTFGFPLFLYGYIFNYIPFKIAEKLVTYLNIREDFVGSVRMAGGMFVFLILYIVEACLVWSVTNIVWALIFLLSLYPAGLFTLHYLKKYFQGLHRIKYIQLFLRKSDLIAHIKVTREALIDELERGRMEYLDAGSNRQS